MSRLPRKVAALAAIPLLALLSACRVESGINVAETDAVNWDFTFDTEELGKNGLTCDTVLSSQIDTLKTAYGPTTYTENANAQGLGCTVSVSLNDTTKNLLYTHSNGVYSVNVPQEFWSAFDSAMKSTAGSLPSYTFAFSMTFPTAIIKASDGGTISGNTVTWSDYDTVIKGISAEANDSTTKADVSPEATSDKSTDASSTKSSSSKRAWISGGVAAIALAAGVMFFVTRGRKNKQDIASAYQAGWTQQATQVTDSFPTPPITPDPIETAPEAHMPEAPQTHNPFGDAAPNT